MNHLTYELLFTCSPFYQCEILGGWEGRESSIQNVCMDELPQEYNSLVIINHSNEISHFLEASLKNNHTSGIIVAANQSCHIPPSCMEYAMQANKPLLLLKDFVGQDIYERINRIMFLHENNLLHMLKNDLTTYFMEKYHQVGLESVLQLFHSMFGGRLYLLNSNMRYIPLPFDGSQEKNFINLETTDHECVLKNPHISIVSNGKEEFFSYSMISSQKHHSGYLLFKKDEQRIDDRDIQLLENITPTITAWLKEKEISSNIHSIYKEQFLYDILHNNIDTESELIELGQLRAMRFTPNAFVLAVNLNTHQTITKGILSDIENFIVDTNPVEANIYTTHLKHRIIGIVFPKNDEDIIQKNHVLSWMQNVQEQTKTKYPSIQLMIGIGSSYFSIMDIYKSFQEAKIALQMEMYGLGSDGIIHYEDIGFVRLLSYIHNDLLKQFSNQYIGKLEDYDNENDTDLLHTLSMYCSQNGDIIRTADNLFIHQNTLRQRLKKIESILNIELNNYTDLVNIIFSLKIAQDMNI